jgi:hypothetical protein
MSLGLLADLTQEIAVNAAHISYELQIAMADSIILATTRVITPHYGPKMLILKE